VLVDRNASVAGTVSLVRRAKFVFHRFLRYHECGARCGTYGRTRAFFALRVPDEPHRLKIPESIFVRDSSQVAALGHVWFALTD
jgi:hypothetical protein